MPSAIRRLLQKFGPGFITGSSDDDPSGIATYTQVGAQFGLGQLWTVLLMFPLMTAVQEMSARIGMVAGDGVTMVLRSRYPRWVLWLFVSLLLIANTINIGADLGAMADSAHLLVPQIPFTVLAILFTFLILILEIFVTYKTYAAILKWFALSLLSYVFTAFLVTTNWPDVIAHLVIPSFQMTKDYVLAIVAVAGTTISPYLFIWQSHEEIEEEIALGRNTSKARKGATKAEIRSMREDTLIGMSFSQLVTFFIMTTAAMTFFRHGLFDIQTTSQAAQALEPLAGKYASILFAAGIIGTGLLAVPVLSASASYAMSDAFQWNEGLYRKFREAHGFYGVITVSTLVGLLINFIGINPIKALIWTAIVNGLITPPIIAIIIVVANNKKVMGRYTNGWLSNALCILTFVLTTIASVLVFVL
jgi:NRAMP (natural resistance-associated macrophage protein)-like metal ion transporter